MSRRALDRALIRRRLLQGASVAAVAAALGVGQAQAQSAAALQQAAGVRPAGSPAGASPVAPPRPASPGVGMSAAMRTAAGRALLHAARATQGVTLAEQAQQAARAAAPSRPDVANGLAVGGLAPVGSIIDGKVELDGGTSGFILVRDAENRPVIYKGTPASADSTGLATWQGASGPRQTVEGGQTKVVIDQTESRAVLSWETFNVGESTTLTFNQSQNGQARTDWVALNRVVGGLDPVTGRRDPNAAPAPSQILGKIEAQGTVLVLNQNGVLFGGKSQINTRAIGATSLEIGRALDPGLNPLTIADRNSDFLAFGLLGYADQAPVADRQNAFTFSAQAISPIAYDPLLEGEITVEAGAQLTAGAGGFVLLAGPRIRNSGTLTANDGQVTLQSGRQITLTRSEGRSDSANPDVRGFIATSLNRPDAAGYAVNSEDALIRAARGYISLGATEGGAVINEGVLQSSTSVSRNGYIALSGGDVRIAPDSTLLITPDENDGLIPQDPESTAGFKPSRIDIGGSTSRIEIGANAMIYAPNASVKVGVAPGAETVVSPGVSRIFVDSGAVIDVAGLKDVTVDASRNQILIRPVKRNELRDSPDYREGFLNGVSVLVDPRISGVREDGVAYVGSPLIEAESYAQQVGVTAAERMTAGGDISLGVAASDSANSAVPSDVIVKSGAVLDVSGGWVTYEAGFVQTTKLVTATGQIVDIGFADLDQRYVAVYSGFTTNQPRFGITENFANPLLLGPRYEQSYSEGRDAGSLTIKASSAALDGTVFGDAFAGPRQRADGVRGTASSGVYNDRRQLQNAPSQLPVGGFLNIQALALEVGAGLRGGGDILIVSDSEKDPVAADLEYGQSISIGPDGELIIPDRDPASILPTERRETLLFSADELSSMGLGQLTFQTTGGLTVAANAEIELTPGAIFDASAGRTILIDGAVRAPSGDIRLRTVEYAFGSIFENDAPKLGDFDIVVNGELSARGQFVNDFGLAPEEAVGGNFVDGGSIRLAVAPRVSQFDEIASVADTLSGAARKVNNDISGSILINDGARLDVSGGAYIDADGALDLSSRGGDVALINETTYFQLANDDLLRAGGVEGFRVTTITSEGRAFVPVNPDEINARVSIADGAIRAHGFSGGGEFTLVTPRFQFGDQPATEGTALSLDFFSETGFGSYDVVSYATALIRNRFDNNLGGFHAVLETQRLQIGQGETLRLVQSGFDPLVSQAQVGQLRALATGGDLYEVFTPGVPLDPFDQRGVELSLGGSIELKVAEGGRIEGAVDSGLTVGKLWNQGVIRLPGGYVRQSQILPTIYFAEDVIAVRSLDEAFTVRPDGTMSETAPNALGRVGSGPRPPLLTNAQLVANTPFYLLGDLDQGEGVRIDQGGEIDLSGTVLLDPRAVAAGRRITTGRVVGGGVLETVVGGVQVGRLFEVQDGASVYQSFNPVGQRAAQTLNAADGAVIDLSGVSATFDQLVGQGGFTPAPVWSDAGSLRLYNGGSLSGAVIDAHGGAALARDGNLVFRDLVLVEDDADVLETGQVSTDQIEASGFDTLTVVGRLGSLGENVDLTLGRGFFVVSPGVSVGLDLNNLAVRDTLAPVVSSGGALTIDAPYIAFDSSLQTVSTPAQGTVGENSVRFTADVIDIRGGVLFDRSIGTAELNARGDLRLTGARPFEQVFGLSTQVDNSLSGGLAVNGDLTITAGQVYPTTGSTFTISSAAVDGVIRFAAADGPTPATPYSAGGSLLVQADQIVHGGVIRTPVGTLTLGSNSPLTVGRNRFAPATTSVVLQEGSITSVAADGLSIPYGTTTDQIEWFFEPTNADPLTAPPAAVLELAGGAVTIEQGATVDVSGGGDLYAYEFIPGVGGSRDVLDRFNPDVFSGNDGFQFPDARQVYAVVPGLSDQAIAALDPIYSSDYGDLYASESAGRRVYLSAAPGLPAGWYTLLPAKYALLPGGVRVVENTGAAQAPINGVSSLPDGTLVVAGRYGGLGGTEESDVRTFFVQSQALVRRYSNIALTSANAKFAADAKRDGLAVPRLPIDAGRLVLNPTLSLTLDAPLLTAPGTGGRGAQVDIAGLNLAIVGAAGGPAPEDAIVLTADSLTNLGASSLLIGGVRTEQADGSTLIDVTAESILVANDEDSPLTAPEIVLAVDGEDASIVVVDGAAIVASGAGESRTGAYVINDSGAAVGQGAVLRVAQGAERLVARAEGDEPGGLTVGVARLEGQSVLLDATGDLRIDPAAEIVADNLALGSNSISFVKEADGRGGLEITPELQALFGRAGRLTLRSAEAISLAGGTYGFGDLVLDTSGLVLDGGDLVRINADQLTLGSSGADLGACETSGDCGDGRLELAAGEIVFGSGTLRTYGFGDSVLLRGETGVFYEGQGGLNAGPADLRIETPIVADRATTSEIGDDTLLPSLELATSGGLVIDGTGLVPVADIPGVPGAKLVIEATSMDVRNATLRATAGMVSAQTVDQLVAGPGATFAAAAYAREFGDEDDPYSVSAPGGLVRLTSLEGGITLAEGSVVNIGGEKGRAGTLDLDAEGVIVLNGELRTIAPEGGASLRLRTGGAVELEDLLSGAASRFSGDIAVQSGQGDLTLVAERTLKAESVRLTAEAGEVTIAGTIDTSGVTGGDISLFGRSGVSLLGDSLLDAHANGYGATDSRQAKGGDILLGTDGEGVIRVADGASIDVAARRGGDRLVGIDRNGVTFYDYVRGDQGGVVHFRAPVIESGVGPGGAPLYDVNVEFAGQIAGARDITLEGFLRYDLADIAADADYTGVTRGPAGEIVLDTGASAPGRVNFLAERGEGAGDRTLVDFIQDFDVSAAYADLGGLADKDEFRARAGVELAYDGDIVLASNWNLGAGGLDVDAAVDAGLMFEIPGRAGVYAVRPGREAEVFARFGRLTYRTGGRVDGEAGIFTLRAGGDLDIRGSITDGFFSFRDQTDPTYLAVQLRGGSQLFNPYVQPSCSGACDAIEDFTPGAEPENFVSIQFPFDGELQGALNNPAPYRAAANSAAAIGGDAVGGAQLFPLLDGNPVESSSYRLVAGADLGGEDRGPGVDPLSAARGETGDLIVSGERSYTYSTQGFPASARFSGDLLVEIGDQLLDPDAWLQAFLAQTPTLTPASTTLINFADAPPEAQSFLEERAEAFDQAQGQGFEVVRSGGRVVSVRARLDLASEFLAELASDFSSATDYTPFSEPPIRGTFTGFSETLIRTGTGRIDMAAGGDIDLRNGETVRNRSGQQLGGVAVYTAGHLADLGRRSATDANGVVREVDPSAYKDTTDVFAVSGRTPYRYGAEQATSPGGGFTSILLTNPVYAEGGGDISLKAGSDVLGRRELFQDNRLAGSPGDYSFIGEGLQAWRVGQVGRATDLQINPQLFGDGVGTLGGGDIWIEAGGDLSDMTVVATTSAVTADTGSGLNATRALMTFGGGDVDVRVAGDLRGGRFDLASGDGDLVVGGDVVSAGRVGSGSSAFDNALRLRLTNATIGVEARGSIAMQGITALGVLQDVNQVEANLNARGFYTSIAGVSLRGNGDVTVANQGPAVLVSAARVTGFTELAVYPGSLEAFSISGDLDLNVSSDLGVAANILLQPSPIGQLRLGAAGDLAPLSLAMEDADPGLLPGYFSLFSVDAGGGVQSGRAFGFPAVLPNTPDVVREQLHDSEITHLNDPEPVRVYAGGDIIDLVLSTPKQTRVSAGRDLVNAMVFAQNLRSSDVTRITAGRDITATTELVRPVISLTPVETLGDPLVAIQGNTFVIGGPGAFYLEAGRDAGPFLNSATVDGFAIVDPSLQEGGQPLRARFSGTYGGGVLSVGAEWNPYLSETGSDVTVMFGVANGVDFSGLRDAYLDPANFGALDGDLFEQVEDELGVPQPDRSRPIYSPKLLEWVQANAAAELAAAYGEGAEVSYDQAYAVFRALPALRQRDFLLKDLYFNELVQSSIPDSPSFGQPSRGYRAVDTLFPVSRGYTDNFPLRTLDGEADAERRAFGPEGYLREVNPDLLAEIEATSANVDERFDRVNAAVDAIYLARTGRSLFSETGNLDLRLATIQTARGGDVSLLGPGGRVLAGSTVRTALQASRRSYDGGRLFVGGQSGTLNNRPLPAAVTSIPVAFEGLLTLRGGTIRSFTDGDLLLNQSRLFALQQGDIYAFSSNGDLNAGQGPRTAASVPPVVVRVGADLTSEIDQTGGVSGAGIGAFGQDSEVYLIAARGTVDAGDAGVRVTGTLIVAAAAVANADAISVSGTTIGVPVTAAADAGAAAASSAAAAAASQAAEEQTQARDQSGSRSVITVNVLGYAGECPPDDEDCPRQ